MLYGMYLMGKSNTVVKVRYPALHAISADGRNQPITAQLVQ